MTQWPVHKKLKGLEGVNISKAVKSKIDAATLLINTVSLVVVLFSALTIANEVHSKKNTFLYTNDGRLIETNKQIGK